jgi:hypothetical protein
MKREQVRGEPAVLQVPVDLIFKDHRTSPADALDPARTWLIEDQACHGLDTARYTERNVSPENRNAAQCR